MERNPLRIALMDRTFTGANVHPDCAQAAVTLGRLCADLGHAVEEATPSFDWNAYLWAVRTAGSASFAAGISGVSRALKREPSPDNLEPLTWLSYLEGRTLRAEDYFNALDVFASVQRTLGAFFERYDILITPMLSQPPADIGWLGTPGDDLDAFWRKFGGEEYSPFAGVFNVTGQPAASIPCHQTAEARPIGAQIVAPFGEEGLLFQLAAQIERARPWRERIPTIHVSRPAATERTDERSRS